MIILESNLENQVFAFERVKEGDRVISIFNFSNEPATFSFNSPLNTEGLNDLFDMNGMDKLTSSEVSLEAWEFIILTNKP